MAYLCASSYFGFKIKVGDPVYPQERLIIYVQKERIVLEVDENFIGVPYIAVSYPFWCWGASCGALVTTENLEHREMLVDMAREIQGFLQNIQGSVQEIAAEAQELSATSQELKSVTEECYGKSSKQPLGL